MAKQIYIDENGNEVLVSGTITNDNNLPHFSGTPTAGTTAEAIEGKDISSSITLNTTKFTLETWGYINAFEHGGYIFVDFAGVKATSAIGENWTDVFTITKNATKKSRLIVYEQVSGGNTTVFSEIRIENSSANVQVYVCPNNYWLAGQMWIRTA